MRIALSSDTAFKRWGHEKLAKRGERFMSYMHHFVLVSTLVATVTSASAQSSGRYGTGQSHGYRYDTVTIPDVQSDALVAAAGHAFGQTAAGHAFGQTEAARHRIPVIPPAKVIIIDNRTGDLWAWSEAQQTVLYLGYIFPLVGQGPIARVITVPEQR
jgi:hypothetical protein